MMWHSSVFRVLGAHLLLKHGYASERDDILIFVLPLDPILPSLHHISYHHQQNAITPIALTLAEGHIFAA